MRLILAAALVLLCLTPLAEAKPPVSVLVRACPVDTAASQPCVGVPSTGMGYRVGQSLILGLGLCIEFGQRADGTPYAAIDTTRACTDPPTGS